MNYSIGTKFYRFEEGSDKLTIVRLKKINEEKKQYSFIDTATNEQLLYTYEEFSSLQFIMLNPDGYLCVTVAYTSGLNDLILTVHRKKEASIDKDNTPYVVCRQSIYDYFTNTANPSKYHTYVGMSVTQDTCPSNINFDQVLGCDKVKSMSLYSVYMDDTLDDILDLINVSKCNSILRGIKSVMGNNLNYVGYCDDVETFLKQNHFMYDFHKCFYIEEVPFPIEDDEEVLELDKVYALEHLLKINIERTYVIKFSKEINPSNFAHDFIYATYVNDHKRLFIIGYDKVDSPVYQDHSNLIPAKYKMDVAGQVKV